MVTELIAIKTIQMANDHPFFQKLRVTLCYIQTLCQQYAPSKSPTPTPTPTPTHLPPTPHPPPPTPTPPLPTSPTPSHLSPPHPTSPISLKIYHKLIFNILFQLNKCFNSRKKLAYIYWIPSHINSTFIVIEDSNAKTAIYQRHTVSVEHYL